MVLTLPKVSVNWDPKYESVIMASRIVFLCCAHIHVIFRWFPVHTYKNNWLTSRCLIVQTHTTQFCCWLISYRYIALYIYIYPLKFPCLTIKILNPVHTMLLRNITSQSETSSSRPASIARYFEASTEQKGEQTPEPTEELRSAGSRCSDCSSFGSEKHIKTIW